MSARIRQRARDPVAAGRLLEALRLSLEAPFLSYQVGQISIEFHDTARTSSVHDIIRLTGVSAQELLELGIVVDKRRAELLFDRAFYAERFDPDLQFLLQSGYFRRLFARNVYEETQFRLLKPIVVFTHAELVALATMRRLPPGALDIPIRLRYSSVSYQGEPNLIDALAYGSCLDLRLGGDDTDDPGPSFKP